MNDTKIQWHPGFCSAMHLELAQNKESLEFHEEFPLNTQPLLIDMLVIRKKNEEMLDNEIGKMFKGHNIMEYKSPDDELGIDVYFKVYAYACLYKSGGKYENAIKDDDVTITLVRERKPMTLLKYLIERGYTIRQEYPGIYYVRKIGFFHTQIVVTRELNPDAHIWLRSLTTKMDKISAEKLISKIHMLTEKDEKEDADSVLKVTLDANIAWFEMIRKERNDMGDPIQRLLQLVQPELEEAAQKGETRGELKGENMLSRLIQTLIKENKLDDINLVTSDADARKQMYEKYGIR